MTGFAQATAGAVALAAGGPDAYVGPAGGTGPAPLSFASMKRTSAVATATAPASGTLVLTAVYLPAGYNVTELGWVSSGAAVAPTHQWLALFDNNRNMLAATADQGAAAVGANTPFQYPIATTAAGAATSFTTTYSGLYYVGVLLAATTTNATTYGNAGGGASSALNGLTPIATGTSSAGLSTVPAFPFQAAAIAATQSTPFVWAS